MTHLKPIRECFRAIKFHDTLLILSLAGFQLFARGSAALPIVTSTGHHADRFAASTIPGTPVGDKVQIFAILDSCDPIGSPTISVEAVQGGTTLTVDPAPPLYPLFGDVHGYYKFIDFDPGLTGAWEIIPTDSTGTGPSAFTPAIVEPEFLPLVTGVTVQGTQLGARVSWTVPNLGSFDPDGITVRVIEAVSGRHMWQSGVLPVQTQYCPAISRTISIG